MSNSARLARTFSSQLWRSPVLWGSFAAVVFYLLIHSGRIQNAMLMRYFASHPVEYIATTMFFVGLVALLTKFFDAGSQSKARAGDLMGPTPESRQSPATAADLIPRLDEQPAGLRGSWLARRLRTALEHIERSESADDVESQLPLGDSAAAESHDSYALVRIIISTIPILGFLGTVIGITRAVAELASLVGEISFDEAINSVVSGLSVAFDTTALALGLSIVLMFAMFFATRRENRILGEIEQEAEDALVGRFIPGSSKYDPHVEAVQQMSQQVVNSAENLVERQAELWKATIDQAHQRWDTLAVTTEKQLETALTRALQNSLRTHGEHMQATEEAAKQMWQDAVDALRETTAATSNQQAEMRRQSDVLLRVVDATDRVIKVEDALNHNLGALRDVRHFDQNVEDLATAVHKLNDRITHQEDVASQTELLVPKRASHAA